MVPAELTIFLQYLSFLSLIKYLPMNQNAALNKKPLISNDRN